MIGSRHLLLSGIAFGLSSFLLLVAGCKSSSDSFAKETKKTDDFPTLQKAYEDQLGKIETTYAELLKKTFTDYTNSLNKLEQTLAKKGDLDGVLAVKKEKEMFKFRREIPEDAVVSFPVELKTLQENVKNQPIVLEADKKKEIAKITSDYIAGLEKIKEALTKNMKIDEAVAVKTEIEKVKGRVDVTPPSKSPSDPESWERFEKW